MNDKTINASITVRPTSAKNQARKRKRNWGKKIIRIKEVISQKQKENTIKNQ